MLAGVAKFDLRVCFMLYDSIALTKLNSKLGKTECSLRCRWLANLGRGSVSLWGVGRLEFDLGLNAVFIFKTTYYKVVSIS